MEQYMPNSDKARSQPNTEKEKEKVEAVVSGTTELKKRSLTGKMNSVPFVKDIRKIGARLITEVLLPDLKRDAHTFCSRVLDSMFYPSSSDTKRSLSMSSISRRVLNRGGQVIREELGNDIRATTLKADKVTTKRKRLGYDEISFVSPVDAKIVLEAMEDRIKKYQIVTVADLFEFAGILTDNYMLGKYGWTDISGATVEMDLNGDYYLDLPQPLPID